MSVLNETDRLQGWASILNIVAYQCKQSVGYSDWSVFSWYDEQFWLVNDTALAAPQSILHYFLMSKLSDEVHQSLLVGKPLVVSDVWQEISDLLVPTTVTHELATYDPLNAIHSWLVLPLMSRTHLIGVISLSYTTPGHFTPDRVKRAVSIVRQAVLTRARIYNRVQDEAVQDERQRLARELHDSVTQVFYGIELSTNAAQVLLERGDTDQVASQLKEILLQAEAGLTEMRALLLELKPESIKTEGLVVALFKQIASLKVRHGLTVEAALGGEPSAPLEVKEALYRIAQESFNNTVKHGRASHLWIELIQESDRLILQVRDNGRGFDPSAPYIGHMGLHSMRERAVLLGGSLQVETVIGGGTQVRASIPVSNGL